MGGADDFRLPDDLREQVEELARVFGPEPIVRQPVGMQMWYASLPVRSVEETAKYYIHVLGFYCPGYGYADDRKVNCQIQRDKAVIGLNELQPGQHPRPLRGVAIPTNDGTAIGPHCLVDAVVLLTDLAAYHAEVSARGARIVRSDLGAEEPTFVVEDPNGYHVMFWQSD